MPFRLGGHGFSALLESASVWLSRRHDTERFALGLNVLFPRRIVRQVQV